MKARIILSLLLLLLTLGSCTQNRGDIGIFFGEWTVDDVQINGVRVDDYPYGLVYWKFQTSVIVISRVEPVLMMDNNGWLGTWEERDGNLILDFDHYSDGKKEKPTGKIPPALLIPAQTVTTFKIIEEKSKTLIVEYIDTAGDTIRFTLRKII